MKTEYFSHVDSNFASDFRDVKHVRINHVFEKHIYIFLRITQILHFCTKSKGIIRNDVEENVLFYGVVRVIPH